MRPISPIEGVAAATVLLVVLLFVVGLIRFRVRVLAGRRQMVDGIADHELVGVRYDHHGETIIIPMRYIEYLEMWQNMDRSEKRAMANKLRKSVEKGKLKRADHEVVGFVHVFDDKVK